MLINILSIVVISTTFTILVLFAYNEVKMANKISSEEI